MKHIAIARFGHEGNSFSPVLTDLDDFKACEWSVGPDVAQCYGGSNTEIGGAIAALAPRPDWCVTYLRCAFATPKGALAASVFETILDEIVAGLRQRRWDAVYLAQHGALNADGRPHADLDILRAVRQAIGESPLGVTFDLHANVSQAEADLMDIAVGYKCHPHTDMAACAEKCLRLLFDRVDGKIRPVGVVRKMSAILPSINGRTTDGPMAEVAAFARDLERAEGLLDVTPYHGYAYGDSEAAGAGVMVYADGDRAKADGAAARVIAKLREVRDRLFVTLPSAAAGIGEAVALARRPQGGPIAVIDAADHPGAGAIGDTPEFLRELLAARPPVPAAFVFFADPSIVRRAHQAGAGGAIAGTLGGRLTDIYGPPVPFEGRVLRLTDGRFRNRGPVQHGMETDFGPTAVLDVSGVHIVVTTLCKSVMDPAFFDLHGIDLAQLGILAIKAKNQFRAAFLDVFRRMIDIDTPGPACLDFSGLPYRRVPRPIYPLDRNVG